MARLTSGYGASHGFDSVFPFLLPSSSRRYVFLCYVFFSIVMFLLNFFGRTCHLSFRSFFPCLFYCSFSIDALALAQLASKLLSYRRVDAFENQVPELELRA